jgi:hypothetical protein
MKKNIKHRFTHPDPEIVRTTGKSIAKPGAKAKPELDPTALIIKRDLKRSLLTILGFAILLIVFYILNNKYDLLTIFSNLFN